MDRPLTVAEYIADLEQSRAASASQSVQSLLTLLIDMAKAWERDAGR